MENLFAAKFAVSWYFDMNMGIEVRGSWRGGRGKRER
jgi:hypothetical protein